MRRRTADECDGAGHGTGEHGRRDPRAHGVSPGLPSWDDAPPLALTPRARFVRCVSRHETLDTGLRGAGLGMAATTGALVGFGVRRGAPGALLSAAGDRLRGIPAFVAPDRSFGLSAMIGLVHHLALSAACGLLFG